MIPNNRWKNFVTKYENNCKPVLNEFLVKLETEIIISVLKSVINGQYYFA